jgi:hypothetical protein
MVPRSTFHLGSIRDDRVVRRRVPRWLAAVPVLFLIHLAVAAEARQVLVLYSNNRLLPANVALDTGLQEAVRAGPGQPVKIFSEFLDEPDFAGDRYELTVSTSCARSMRITHSTPCLSQVVMR